MRTNTINLNIRIYTTLVRGEGEEGGVRIGKGEGIHRLTCPRVYVLFDARCCASLLDAPVN